MTYTYRRYRKLSTVRTRSVCRFGFVQTALGEASPFHLRESCRESPAHEKLVIGFVGQRHPVRIRVGVRPESR